MNRFTSERQRTGKSGEDLAAYILECIGFSILARNYSKRVGEIDIIAMKGPQLYFFEVKKSNTSNYNPFQNITRKKLRSIQKTALLYLFEKSLPLTTNYSIGAISITYRANRVYVEIIECV